VVRKIRQVLIGALAAVLVGTLAPVAPAQAQQVELPAAGECSVSPRYVKNDFRAMWIASVVNIDWPSRTGLPAAQQQAEMRKWLDLAVRNNFNAVVLQVRPTADAMWPSRFEPWSRWLTGTQGRDPGYDPLQFAVDEAHKRGLALHAWFNPYRVSMNTKLANLDANHPARRNPDWVVAKDGKLYYNPGIPEVRSFIIDAMMDAVDRYDIDGVHFDDYFYPYPGSRKPFQDTAAFRTYGGGFSSRAEWRRANIDGLIKELSDRIEASKPWVQFGVSPFAVWRNAGTDPAGSKTRAGVQTYDDLYADTRKWVREGWIDYIAPQVYWPRGFTIADYEQIVPWWAKEIDVSRRNGHNVGLFIGEATYRAGTNRERAWRKPNVLLSHRRYTRKIPQVNGALYFSAKDVQADRRGTTTKLVQRFYSRPALPPVLGKPVGPAASPVRNPRQVGASVRWAASPGAHSYVMYRVPKPNVARCDLADARYLQAVLPADGATLEWRAPDVTSTYVVTAVDRFGRESAGQVVAR
jgi:uncharacterized lipoprotein YddW (UPF0748 family)